ncbi:MAG: Gfo/Idh/MocA family protein [Anaerolineae bacterium]
MLRVGLIGLGFIGQVHFHAYEALKAEVKIAAVCDIERSRLEQAGGITGNIGGEQQKLNLDAVALYTDAAKMLAEQKLDIVSICLPTYLHAKYAIMALQAGANVFCEKPMAIDVAECDAIISAAEASGKELQVGHVIRFWPEFTWARQAMMDGTYGKLLAVHFQRLSQTPTWSWQNWLLDGTKSGGAVLDLHIHDADFVQYLLGLPHAIYSRSYNGPSKDADHISTDYLYEGDAVVTATGGWVMTKSFGFRQAFDMVLEGASICYDATRSPSLTVYPAAGEAFSPEITPGDAYHIEIAYFVHKVAGQKQPEIITPFESRESVRLILAEKKSAQTKRVVAL